MDDPEDPSSRPFLNYHQAEEPSTWSMASIAVRVGWVSVGFSVLLFIDPYLPELHVLMLVPIGGAIAGLTLAVLAAQKSDQRREALVAMFPNLLALVIPAISMLTRYLLPMRWR